ncbi:hypothetical protein AAVH_01244 [Aphelenchoides avenae]|nr:hypothetical protein AAVH_01244 [Aphelenchus avenae]
MLSTLYRSLFARSPALNVAALRGPATTLELPVCSATVKFYSTTSYSGQGIGYNRRNHLPIGFNGIAPYILWWIEQGKKYRRENGVDVASVIWHELPNYVKMVYEERSRATHEHKRKLYFEQVPESLKPVLRKSCKLAWDPNREEKLKALKPEFDEAYAKLTPEEQEIWSRVELELSEEGKSLWSSGEAMHRKPKKWRKKASAGIDQREAKEGGIKDDEDGQDQDK